MTGFLLSGMVIHSQRSIMRDCAVFLQRLFLLWFMQTQVSLGSAAVFSQDEWSWKTGYASHKVTQICTKLNKIILVPNKACYASLVKISDILTVPKNVLSSAILTLVLQTLKQVPSSLPGPWSCPGSVVCTHAREWPGGRGASCLLTVVGEGPRLSEYREVMWGYVKNMRMKRKLCELMTEDYRLIHCTESR